MSERDLPFYRLDTYPERFHGPGVLVRLIDALGFRFRWATEGLREADYAFSPGSGCVTIGELVEHVWGLINWVHIAVAGHPGERPSDPAGQRALALDLLYEIRRCVAALDEAQFAALYIGERPFWHAINGPLADALTHVGQINSFRRLAGNPTPGARVFTGDPPSDAP